MAIKALMAGAALLPLSHCGLPALDSSASLPRAIPCTVGQPPLSSADQLTPAMSGWMLVFLKSGSKLCGWAPPGR